MPRPRRSDSEIEAVRNEILDEALELFVDAGWQGFSMRKLGARLGIAAKTIYNYFDSQDELYLGLLTRGFRSLGQALAEAVESRTDPFERLDALIDAYAAFAFDNANLYGLMFTWHVPKYDDYVGTPSEDTALVELETALDSQRLTAATIAACASGPLGDDDLRFITIRLWSQLHGYIAGMHNHLLDYMHPDPASLRERMIAQIKDSMVREILALQPSVTADHPTLH
ncbi:MAG TPA: TetR/AcrR family transcriptional regulator [Actinomycetota bacterium]|nr:TetR/AcrR family transcriptional regulator [Actinomycetota bacterium]